MNVTRNDLAAAIVGYGLTHEDARGIVDDVLNEISRDLVLGHTVKIGSFATFSVCHKRSRIGRNPKKPAEGVVIKPRRVVVFTASQKLRKKVANQQKPLQEESFL